MSEGADLHLSAHELASWEPAFCCGCAWLLLYVPGWFMRTLVMFAQTERWPRARATAMR